MLLVYGSLALPVALAFLGRLEALPALPRSTIAVAVGGAAVAGVILGLAGVLHIVLLAIALGIALQAVLAVRIEPVQRAMWLLLAGGIGCLLVPELLYVRDEFDGSDLYRMNTVFKLGYQAWLLLGLGGVMAFAWRREWLPARAARLAAGSALAAVLLAAAVYPVAGTYASRGGFAAGADARRPRLAARAGAGRRGRDRLAGRSRAGGRGRARVRGPGLLRLRPRAHLDVHRAPDRARLARPRAPVGARRGTREQDVERMYRGGAAEARPLLRRYGVRYVVVGPIERTDHGDAGVAKWDELGRRVFDRDGTEVWDLARPPGPAAGPGASPTALTPRGAGTATRAGRPSGSTARAA